MGFNSGFKGLIKIFIFFLRQSLVHSLVNKQHWWTKIFQTSNDRAWHLPYRYFGNRPNSKDEKSKRNLAKSVPNTY